MSTHYNHMFHVFQIYVAYVLFGSCKSRSGVTYIAMSIHLQVSVCFKYFSCFQMYVEVVYLDVAYVALAINVRCKCMLSNVSAILNVCCKCFIWMLHMLLWPFTYVASVCFKCFNCFKCMLQVFYLDVTYVAMVIHIGL
jgi:hypothetical protein